MVSSHDNYKETEELLAKAQAGDSAARARVYEANLGLVYMVMERFKNSCYDYEDLFQVGSVGLLKAIDKFDFQYQVRFSTYAVPMIIGEIRRYLRDNNSIRISRSMRDVAYKAMQIKEKLTNERLRDPTIEEIAAEMQLPKEDVVLALESIVEPVSLYEPVYSDGGDTIYIMDQVGDNNDDKNWLDEISLKEAIRNLNDREKRILYLRFFKGMTQIEVSSEIGISQAQVSRLEKGALEHIKKQI